MNIGIHCQDSALCRANQHSWLTVVRDQASVVLDVEIWERAMDVSAYLLPCLRGAEDSDDWDLRGVLLLRLIKPPGQSRVEFCR